MSTNADELRPQVMAALATFEKMSANEQESQVSKYFAERTNELVSMGKQAMPSVHIARWPKSIIVRASMSKPRRQR